jgi:endogenous inhibitor of DNA gyrase (YacG/DUF329 family)
MLPKAPSPKVTAECPQCGKAFTYHPSRPIQHCSRACYVASLGETKTSTACPQCGKVFAFHKSWPRKYCSNICKGNALAVHTRRRETATCERCGKVFEYKPSANHGRFCSLACFGAVRSARPKPDAPTERPTLPGRPEHWKPLVALTCTQCQKVLMLRPSDAADRKFCSRACAGAWRREHYVGEHSTNWTGGGEQYRGPSWVPAIAAVRERDRVCTECGKTPEANGYALDVHHIVPFDTFGPERHAEANALGNLRAVCRSCHHKIEPAGYLVGRDGPRKH